MSLISLQPPKFFYLIFVVFINNMWKKNHKFVTFHFLKAEMGTEAGLTDIKSRV